MLRMRLRYCEAPFLFDATNEASVLRIRNDWHPHLTSPLKGEEEGEGAFEGLRVTTLLWLNQTSEVY